MITDCKYDYWDLGRIWRKLINFWTRKQEAGLVIILRGSVDEMEEIIFSQSFLLSGVTRVWRYLDPTPDLARQLLLSHL